MQLLLVFEFLDLAINLCCLFKETFFLCCIQYRATLWMLCRGFGKLRGADSLCTSAFPKRLLLSQKINLWSLLARNTMRSSEDSLTGRRDTSCAGQSSGSLQMAEGMGREEKTHPWQSGEGLPGRSTHSLTAGAGKHKHAQSVGRVGADMMCFNSMQNEWAAVLRGIWPPSLKYKYTAALSALASSDA